MEVLTEKLSLSEYRQKPNRRKDIYTFIEQLIIWIQDTIESDELKYLKSILPQFAPHWTALCNAAAVNKKIEEKEWGTSFQVSHLVLRTRPRDTVLEHESKMGNEATEAGAKGTADTTRKIIKNSLDT